MLYWKLRGFFYRRRLLLLLYLTQLWKIRCHMILILESTSFRILITSWIILDRTPYMLHCCYLILCELSWLRDSGDQRWLGLFLRQGPLRFLVKSSQLTVVLVCQHDCVNAWLVSSTHISERNLHGWLSCHEVMLDVTIFNGFYAMGLRTVSISPLDFCFCSLRYRITTFYFWFYVLTLFYPRSQIIGRSFWRYLRLVNLLNRP